MKLLFSMSLTGALLLVFAITIGVATFIENDFGAASAQAVVYKALWFELLLAFMVVNMIGVIIVRKLYVKEKWGSLLFHVAFIIILLGAAITRFTGQEGLMHIREGQIATSFLTDETYISGTVLVDDDKVEFSKKVLLVPIKKSSFSKDVRVGEIETSITLLKHIPNAQEIVETNTEVGEPILTLVTEAANGGRENRYLRRGQLLNLNNLVIGFDAEERVAINIMFTASGLMMNSLIPVDAFSMDTQERKVISPDSLVNAPFRHLLSANNVNFVLSVFNPQGQVMLVSAPAGNTQGTIDALVFSVKQGEHEAEIVVKGGKGIAGTPQFISAGEANIMLAYGSKNVAVPFGIQLNDFQLDRYPGSNSPSSYASEVTVKGEKTEFPFRIYMNNILSYKGYRLYQSSYDRDELGTVLSINKDKPGTYVSYAGYLLLAIGLLYILFNKTSRFTHLSMMIDDIHKKRATLSISLLIMLFFSSNIQAQAPLQKSDFIPTVAQADSLSVLIYQTNDGRMAPLHSLASDLLRKIHKNSTYEGLTASQVLLGMMTTPYTWQNKPIIEVKNKVVQGMLGIQGKYAAYNDFFNEEGRYKLNDVISAAYEKKPAQRSQLDKDLMKVDERINISFMIYRGDLLKIFPVPNDPDNRWVSPSADDISPIAGEDSAFVRMAFHHYVDLTVEGNDSAAYILNGIKKFQRKYGAEVLPSSTKTSLEISFNKLNIFERLFPFYLYTGFFLLIITFIKILKPRTKLKYMVKTGQGLIILGFIVHTLGLALRWYVSGHEPWSNGYESMIYIAWATLLAGLLFSRKSEMTLAVTAMMGGIILLVAHLSWMDPEITNLVPVLKSYWLTIHVATIVASYGFLGLGALLAFVNLISFIMKRKTNLINLDLSIRELTYVIEMTLTFGLILLTIGNFLGGIWANESWGRYWGWDPKETWALASIIFYSFVLHMRFIPGLQSLYAFNLASLLAYASILMTYFGVNFYLSGLHSYAAGDPVPIPTFVYYTAAVITIVAVWAYFNNDRFKPKVNKVEKE
jgi:cytochrome c-type biogenesis protein CcsB